MAFKTVDIAKRSGLNDILKSQIGDDCGIVGKAVPITVLHSLGIDNRFVFKEVCERVCADISCWFGQQSNDSGEAMWTIKMAL